MAKFVDIHTGFVGVTPEEFLAAHEADLKIQAEEGVEYERAWLDPVSGKAFCLISAPSREAAMRIHERAGHPTDEVYEVTVEV
jgi:Nickel responsive protein SCO4226-like